MAVIDYSSGPRVAVEGSHAVYTRASWAAPWTLQPNLKAMECQWNAAPAMNSALLRWDLGDVILPGDWLPTTFGPWVGRGQFVRVDWTADDGSLLRWVGFIDASEWPTEAFGVQYLVCYGLERALALTPILDSVWRDGSGASPVARRSGAPRGFNTGHRSDGPNTGRSDDTVAAGGSVYAFAADADLRPQPWSTREIVRYLLTYHLPTNSYGVASVPWAVDQIALLPDWDAPTVQTEGRTVWDVLLELVNPERQLGFTTGSDGAAVTVRFFTHLASTLTIGLNSLSANPRQHVVTFGPDALTDARLSDVGGGYDQVICRGARRQTICTLNYEDHLTDAWTAENQAKYDAGASGDAGYGGWEDDEKRQRNAAVRGQGALRDVYRRWALKDTWDYQIDGTDVFPGNTTPQGVRMRPNLPILDGIAWEASLDAAWFDRKGEGRPLLVSWQDPTLTLERMDNAALEQLSDSLGLDLDFDFTVRPSVAGRTLALTVDGGPQYMIAASEFDGLDEDTTAEDSLDYTTVAVTVALEEDRFCQAAYPATAAAADIVRRLVVDCGDGYQQVRVHPGTVAAIDSDGEPQESDGGTLVDDSAALASLARIIAEGALLTRKTVDWTSLRKIATVGVGDLILTANGQAVAAPVTAVHIAASLGVGVAAGPTRQSFQTFRGQIDPLALVRQLRDPNNGVGGTAPRISGRNAIAVRGARVRALRR